MKFKCLLLGMVINGMILIFSVNSVYSATYYIKNGGNDRANGLSDANAWATINKVNSVNFADGDIIQFKRGQTFDDAVLTLGGVTNPTTKTITLQAYGIGTLPWLGGTVHRAIYIDDDNQDGLSLVFVSSLARHRD